VNILRIISSFSGLLVCQFASFLCVLLVTKRRIKRSSKKQKVVRLIRRRAAHSSVNAVEWSRIRETIFGTALWLLMVHSCPVSYRAQQIHTHTVSSINSEVCTGHWYKFYFQLTNYVFETLKKIFCCYVLNVRNLFRKKQIVGNHQNFQIPYNMKLHNMKPRNSSRLYQFVECSFPVVILSFHQKSPWTLKISRNPTKFWNNVR